MSSGATASSFWWYSAARSNCSALKYSGASERSVSTSRASASSFASSPVTFAWSSGGGVGVAVEAAVGMPAAVGAAPPAPR